MSTKLWGGRFSDALDPLMEEFNASIGFDRRLWQVDIRGSQAYAHALARADLLTANEAEQIVAGLERSPTSGAPDSSKSERATRTFTPPTSAASPN